jgi:hypothetical protein
MSVYFKIFNLLEGKWRINRFINGVGKLDGFALFEKCKNNELFYNENGQFTFDDSLKSFEASQKYIYKYINQTKDDKIEDDIHVYFHNLADETNSRLFHKFGPCKMQNFVTFNDIHYCGNDIYHVTYEFTKDSIDNILRENDKFEFIITYDVKGPKKNYLSKTYFKKLKT